MNMRKDQEIEQWVSQAYPGFGVNKRQELVRLAYEIAKREGCAFSEVFPPIRTTSFGQVKHHLLQRRFPDLTQSEISRSMPLKSLNLDPRHQISFDPDFQYYPQDVYIDPAVAQSALARRTRALFSRARFHALGAYPQKGQGPTGKHSIPDYNRRRETLFIVQEQFDFIRPCPCADGAVRCGYYNMKLGMGCPYECAYCFLQSYTNAPGIVLPASIEDFFDTFERTRAVQRLGSGQFTDSLVFDAITQYSSEIVDFFRDRPDHIFEFKTKSAQVDRLLQIRPAENIVVAWSLNPQTLIDQNEWYTASLNERLNAAAACAAHGYKVAFHFDPIIYFDRWESAYQCVVARLFKRIPASRIAWISLGALRMTWDQKQAIESRFPDNPILDESLIRGFDQKLRYPWQRRKSIFASMVQWVRAHSRSVKIYLCMEERSLHTSVGLDPGRF
jgi:spore photoproduct lyase